MSEKEKENFVNEIMNFVNEQPDPQKSLDDVVNVLKKIAMPTITMDTKNEKVQEFGNYLAMIYRDNCNDIGRISRYDKMWFGKRIAQFQRKNNISDHDANELRKLANLKPKKQFK